jgi:hypothetical protein
MFGNYPLFDRQNFSYSVEFAGAWAILIFYCATTIFVNTDVSFYVNNIVFSFPKKSFFEIRSQEVSQYLP